MARRTLSSDAPPRGYAYLTAASALGADLRPALRVLMLLPDTRKDISVWLRDRAAAADPAVGTYFEMHGSRQDWNDWRLREELVAILDERHPRLARRDVAAMECSLDFDRATQAGTAVRPEFLTTDDNWRDIDSPLAPVADPWSAALDRAKAVPGCGWVPVPPALRQRLESHILVHWHVHPLIDRGEYEDALRAAARFGHPLSTVFLDFASRQNWAAGLCDELRALDRRHARFRDPPGEASALQPLAGPYRVLCCCLGFWDGARWTGNLDEAERFPSYDPASDELVRTARLRAEEVGGVSVVMATIWTHPTDRRDEARPTKRPRR